MIEIPMRPRRLRLILALAGFGALLVAAASVAAADPADLSSIFTDELQVRSTVETPADLDEFLRQVAS